MNQDAVEYLDNPLAMAAPAAAVQLHGATIDETPLGEIMPDAVRAWLARIRLLEGVPFAHLVPDAELLPPESIRFFYLDREWTDALVQGALAVGTVTTLDREHLRRLHRRLRDEIDGAERTVRLTGADRPHPGRPAETVTGFLLRSRAVSGWPALHVRAYRAEIGADDAPVADNDPRRLRLLRLERLAPAVLLCLFDGVPEVVHVEEPRQGIQFGVDLVAGATGTAGAVLQLRDVLTAKRLDLTVPRPPGSTTAEVPFRRGAPGVIHMAELARRIAAQPATHVNDFEGAGVQSAELAMELLQFPYRQVFGDPAKGTVGGGVPLTYADVFRPQIAIEEIRVWQEKR
jgi:hypothetical protein